MSGVDVEPGAGWHKSAPVSGATSTGGGFLWRASPPWTASGSPVVFMPGLGPHSVGRTAAQRLLQRVEVLSFGRCFQVWTVGRGASLRADVTLEELAEDHADAIRTHFERPVDVIGESTGGGVALLLAERHPELVNRLVVVSAAGRMSRQGQKAQRDAAGSIRSGNRRRAAGMMLGATTTRPGVASALRAVGRILGGVAIGRDDANLTALMNAEDGFDAQAALAHIQVPTLLIGGERDGYYSPDLMKDAASLIPQAVHRQLRGKGHLSVVLQRSVRSAVRDFLQPGSPGPNPTDP